MASPLNLQEWFGGIDIYLFDQLLKGRIVPGMKVLDAGCGTGRNLVYLLRSGYEVCGVDESSDVIAYTQHLATELERAGGAEEKRNGEGQDNFRVERVEQMSWGDSSFDLVMSSAVLHFARSEELWRAMVHEMWRVLKPGGIFFARLASSIGIEKQVRLIEGRRYRLPDGSDRFLVDEEMLLSVTAALGGEFLDPIKTTLVHNMRAMTTWCVKKGLRS
jgi:tellurite methyltransferase